MSVFGRDDRRGTQAGVTIVELMITLVVASLVASSTFVFFAGQQKIYETQGKLLNIQQNLWGAMEIIGRNVRAAGIGMANCVRPDADRGGPDLGDPPPAPTVGFPNPATGLRAFVVNSVVRIPPMWIVDGAAGAPDQITVAFGTNTFGNTADSQLTQAVSTNMDAIVSLGTVYRANEFMLLVDSGTPTLRTDMDRGCTLFQITSVTGNTLDHAGNRWNAVGVLPALFPPLTLQCNGPGCPGVPPAAPAFSYPVGTSGGVRNFGTLNWVRFFVDTTGMNNTPSVPPRLMMDRLDGTNGPQVLSEGIEDMQIAYGCDIAPPLLPTDPIGTPTNPADGVMTEGTALVAPAAGAQAASEPTRLVDEWIFNTTQATGANESPRLDCNHPTAVRITLIARSSGIDPAILIGSNNFKPGIEDGLAGPKDQYRHRVISTTVNPRNRE